MFEKKSTTYRHIQARLVVSAKEHIRLLASTSHAASGGAATSPPNTVTHFAAKHPSARGPRHTLLPVGRKWWPSPLCVTGTLKIPPEWRPHPVWPGPHESPHCPHPWPTGPSRQWSLSENRTPALRMGEPQEAVQTTSSGHSASRKPRREAGLQLD